uniref:Glucosylceramidase n=1 Tax=Ditylenchus dipsaci TaxID=166011 RepID=A0A915DAW4_9BILA
MSYESLEMEANRTNYEFLFLHALLLSICSFTVVHSDESYTKCMPKVFYSPSDIVCVCNSTYCDTFPPLGQLENDQAAVYISSKSGKRFNKTVLSFSNNTDTEPKKMTNDTKTSCWKHIMVFKELNTRLGEFQWLAVTFPRMPTLIMKIFKLKIPHIKKA